MYNHILTLRMRKYVEIYELRRSRLLSTAVRGATGKYLGITS
jgi:hypothetical protein